MDHFWVSLERRNESEPHWQVRQINGVEQQEWWKGRSYSSWEAYADEMRLDGWELPIVDLTAVDGAVVDHREYSQATLNFRRARP